MRKANQEIRGDKEIRTIMEEAQVCRIAFADAGEPYILPMFFGLGEHCLYLHSAAEGRKLDMLKRNDRVCFEMDILDGLKRAETPCAWSAAYRSVVGVGRAVLLEDLQEKRLGLDRIMAHYRGRGPFSYPDALVAKTAVIRIDIVSVTGKRHE